MYAVASQRSLAHDLGNTACLPSALVLCRHVILSTCEALHGRYDGLLYTLSFALKNCTLKGLMHLGEMDEAKR